MKKLFLSVALALLAILPVIAVPTLTPSKPAEIRANVASIRPVPGDEGLSILSLDAYEGVDRDTAKQVYKVLRAAGFDVKYPRRAKVDLLLRAEQTKGLKAGERVQISNYAIYGHTLHSMVNLSKSVSLKKLPKN